ncbi:MAG: hypothetical protein NWQ38_01005 [Cellulophaga sp.]|nr:hypothetical protein [Cellulophaga sp.]
MAPIKFEEHIKDKFEGRKIQPSIQAWDKISSQINTSYPTKKKGITWYAIAASIIGLLIAILFLLNNNAGNSSDKNIIVVTPNTKIKTESKPQNNKIEVFKNNEAMVNTKSEKLKNTSLPSEKNIFDNNKSESLAETNSTTSQPKLQRENKVNLAMEILINEKVNLIVAQIDSLVLKNNAVTDAEVDALLRKAQDEILTQKVFKNSNSVDAMALLNQAESELDLSVRDQLFEALKSGYLKVRTAVADRNK